MLADPGRERIDYFDFDGDYGADNDFDGVCGCSASERYYSGTSYGQTPVGRMPVGVLWPGADLSVVDLQRPEVTVNLPVGQPLSETMMVESTKLSIVAAARRART